MQVTKQIELDDSELYFDFVRAPGPGGQNVNKVATAVRLRFHIRQSVSLPDSVRDRLLRLGGRRVTSDGVLTLVGRRYRTQASNRRDVLERLKALIVRAAAVPKVRRRTKPTPASRERRLEDKRKRSRTKARRSPVRSDRET